MVNVRINWLLVAGIAALAVVLVVVCVRIKSADAVASSPRPIKAVAKAAGSEDAAASVSASSLPMETWIQKIGAADSAGLKALMAEALSISDPEFRHEVVTAITSRWMKVDARGFLTYLTALEVHGDKLALGILSDALRDSLTELTPAQAGSDDIRLIVQRLVSILVAADPEGALQWARLWLLDDTLETALVSISRSFAHTDVARGLRLIETIQSPLRRNQASAMLAGIWASQNPAAAYEWASNLTERDVRAMSLNSVFLAMAQSDPERAASELRSQAERLNSEYLSERKAEMAAAGIKESDLAQDSETYLEMVRSGAVAPPVSPDVELLAIAAKVIGAKLAESDPEGALAWADSLTGDYLELMTISGVVEGWGRESPIKAAEYLASTYPTNMDLAKSLYGAWAAVDALAAANGTAMIADATQRDTVLADVIKIWSVKGDATEALRYVEQLPAAQKTDSVKYSLSTTISQVSPVEAWTVATGIEDPGMQYRALKSALSVLAARNPDEAVQLLKSSALSPSVSEGLGNVLDAVIKKS
jgi:hypothetical protein